MSPSDRLAAAIPVENVRAPELESATVDFDRRWQQSLLRPCLLTLMLGCIVTAATYVFVVLIPTFTTSIANMIILCSALAALTNCIMGALTWNISREQRERLRFRAIEPVGWALLLRLGLWFVMDDVPPVSMILSQPLTTLFDGPFIAGGLIVLLIWLVAGFLNQSLLKLALQEDEVSHIVRAYGRLSDTVENTLRSDRRAQLDRFTAAWIGLGIVVIVLAAGSQVRTSDNAFPLTIHAQNIHPRAIVSTVVYFFAGFLLIGQAHLVALRARWALDGLGVDESRFRNWMFYVVGCVALVAFITSLVPVGNTILLWQAITAFGQIVMTLIGYLKGALSWLLNLFIPEIQVERSGLQPAALPEFSPPEEVARETSLCQENSRGIWCVCWENLPTCVFLPLSGGAGLIWGYHLLAARGLDWRWLWGHFAQIWRLFRQMMYRTMYVGHHIVTDIVNRVTGAWHQVSPRTTRQAQHNMDWDEQVQFTYLSILDEAAEQGVERREAETPRQFAPRLAKALDAARTARANTEATGEAEPEPGVTSPPVTENSDVDVKEVTEAFYKARYSMQTAGEQDFTRAQLLLQYIRTLWQRNRQ